ncbi:MAG: glutamate--tRNA ligase family protein [Candidatus Shikimatogenerans bostrichidophilus]|nr:MAG: glutamate--tRNA ligase family protein [Candidatus Shikimatogenerans bostrichidophilus]
MNNFILKIINKDLKNRLSTKDLKFRFSPEPSSVLHLGHIKAIYINFKLAELFNSEINVRIDDTNPKTSKLYYVNSIIKSIYWLGYKNFNLTFASDYFNLLYKWAKLLIKKKKSIYTIYKKKKKNYNIYNIKKNLFLFKQMKIGKYKENEIVLRAKINKKSYNYHLKDPIMYRVINKKHYRTKYDWYIYPTYDWAHGQSDYIEKISHSLCSIEFENHKPLYNWFINNIYNINFNKLKPKQIEFSRLNIHDSITSKRKLNILYKKNIVKNFNDLRLSTLISFKKKGYKPKYLINFIKKLGYTKRNTYISINALNLNIKKKLFNNSFIIMVVLSPIKLIIANFKKNKIKKIKINNNYCIFFSRYIYIEKKDFKKKHDKNFYRLSFSNYIRLKYSYIIKAYKKKKNKIYCKIYNNINSKYIKSTIQWISKIKKNKINIINYKYIYFKKKKIYNVNSIKKIYGYTNILPSFLKTNKIYQFLRIGFFFLNKKYNFITIMYMIPKF